MEQLIGERELEWIMIDASYVKAHAHACGARGGNQGIARTKGGSTPRYIWPWMRAVCRSDALLQTVSYASLDLIIYIEISKPLAVWNIGNYKQGQRGGKIMFF